MPEPVTYYHRDGVDYAVFAWTVAQVRCLEACLIEKAGGDDPGADALYAQAFEAMKHLEGRQRGGAKERTA